MKTVTTREAQHHLSKVLEMVSAGEEVVITRRGKQVAKLSPVEDESAKRKVDWAESLRRRDEVLGHLPRFDYGVVERMREEERY